MKDVNLDAKFDFGGAAITHRQVIDMISDMDYVSRQNSFFSSVAPVVMQTSMFGAEYIKSLNDAAEDMEKEAARIKSLPKIKSEKVNKKFIDPDIHVCIINLYIEKKDYMQLPFEMLTPKLQRKRVRARAHLKLVK